MHTRGLMSSCCHLNRLPPRRPYFTAQFCGNTSAHARLPPRRLHGGADTAGRVCERTQVFTLAVSLGSVESLIEHPARMTHCTTAGTPVGVSDSLLRLSIGLQVPLSLP